VTLVGRHGVAASTVLRDDVFCAQTILGEGPLIVPDAVADPRFKDLPMVREGCRFYAGAPLKDPLTGCNIGALCIAGDTPRQNFDRSQREALVGLARLLTEELDRHQQDRLIEGRARRSEVA
jgi:GAF domain-containing protein